MSLKYRCLILDHDDTVVDSTATVHYPAYLEMVKELRPGTEPVDLDGWFRKNFDPGILGFLRDELGFSDEEMQKEYTMWRTFVLSQRPHFYPGITDFLIRYARQGGKIAVVSHSERDIIERDYRETGGGAVLPDVVFGWEMEEHQRKPHPWPVHEIMRQFSLEPGNVLIVDDLKPAVEMAHAAGVDIAAAGWAHQIPEIVSYMKKHATYYCRTVQDLETVVFGR